MTLTPAFKRVQIARTTLLLDSPFFGVLALGLHLIEDASCPTAYTNGRDLGFNPTFVMSLSNDQLMGLIAHEVMHCACGHPWRRGRREPKKWNYAADYAINGVLLEAGFVLPDGGLHDPQWAGKWSEYIYDRIPDLPPNNGSGSGSGQASSGSSRSSGSDPGSWGEVRDAPANDADAPTEADWQQAQEQALRSAARGTLPGSLQRQIGELTAPRVDWRSLLRKYVTETARADYSWSLPNRRYLCAGLFLPSLHSQEAGPIAIAVDTSGSIDATLLQQFAGEINGIASEVQPSKVDVIYCDAQVHRVDTFDRGDPIVLSAIGGGGTDFAPVFAHIEQSGEYPRVLIYLTDMYGSFPSEAPEYPVIWCSYSSVRDAPFGDVVPVE